jgi:hypothetical protein
LTTEEVIYSGFSAKWSCSYAYEDGVLLSIYYHTVAHRTESCDNCTLKCHIGSTPFTREDRRNEGIFNGLYAWIREQYNYDTVVYNSGDYPPDFDAVQAAFDVKLGVLSGQRVAEGYADRLPLVLNAFNKIAEVKGLVGV